MKTLRTLIGGEFIKKKKSLAGKKYLEDSTVPWYTVLTIMLGISPDFPS